MPERFPDGTWLLLDAAGPSMLAGLVSDGRWLARDSNDGEFLEWFQPAIAALLDRQSLQLGDLAGILCATGPGSTLGLRLAAMCVRSLLALPGLARLDCLQYQNLELAIAAGLDLEDPGGAQAVAPWRRDRLHHARLEQARPLRFAHGCLDPAEAAARQLTGYVLGRRPNNETPGIAWRPYPSEAIPAVLAAHPGLLQATRLPAPYTAEDPEFARWSAQRHPAR